ncbi:MAG: phenylalanine--tRNA ligase subunit beta [Phycisphaerae bacterium]|nr:phenylalanine--tRNA ligase subunit beta [Phycisphaerae bacterium]
MLTSVAWLNRYLHPATVNADEAEHVLTHVGFPIESKEALPSGDTRLDVELTSNRGDCLCHVGLAREIAAATGRALVMPKSSPVKPSATKASSVTSVENQLAAGGCPRFTARVIRGVKVGPSPKWLAEALESVGLRAINNVVDVTNFINLELGHPCHVFDLNALAGKRLVVRHARKDESVTALDGRKHAMRPDEMVVADAEKAVSIAGVIGGLDSGVTERTTDVLFEMATWDPIAVRRAARRLDIRTDASHRFERYVDARDLEWASLRGASLIAELSGGELLDGMIDARGTIQPRTEVVLRVSRCEHLLGIHVPADRITALLRSIGVEVDAEGSGAGGVLRCSIPHHRHDLTREVDLIEEVGRLNGFDKIELAPMLDVHLELSHPDDWAKREKAMGELSRVLTGAGFFETVTFSFIAQREAEMFRQAGQRLLKVDEERRKGGPYLRPSVIPSLLTCRRANQDGQVRPAGGVRLFECASTFAERDDGRTFGRMTEERRVLTLLADAPAGLHGPEARQAALRLVRGAVETVALALGGPGTIVEVDPVAGPHSFAALEDETEASVKINGVAVGLAATVSGRTLQQWGLETPLAVAEVSLQSLIDLYPPRAVARELPRFPGIERDLSVIVAEEVAWGRIAHEVLGLRPALMERLDFVGVYRGKQIGIGRKSVTLRMTFRDPERTLRHEEVDPQVAGVVSRLAQAVGGEVRSG